MDRLLRPPAMAALPTSTSWPSSSPPIRLTSSSSLASRLIGLALPRVWRRKKSTATRVEASAPPCGTDGEDLKVGVIGRPKRRRAAWRKIFFASRKFRSVMLLNVLTVIYASNIPVVKEIESVVDPALFNMVRFVLSAIPFLPFIYLNRGDQQTCSNGIELGCWVTLGYLAQALGLLTSDAGRASFLSAFTVIVVPLIDGIFGSNIPAITWLGAVVSLIGVAMLECSGSSPSIGDLSNLLSAVFFGIHILRTERISRTTEKGKIVALLGYEVSVVALFSAFWYFCSSMIGNLSSFNPFSWKWATPWDWIVCFPWIPTLYTGVFSTGLCLWAEMSAMCDVSATETAIIYGLEPVWGASIAWFLLGERWTSTGWLGAALILVGSLTVQIFGSAPEKCKQNRDNGDLLLSNRKSNDPSLSAVTVHHEENLRNLVKKHKL